VDVRRGCRHSRQLVRIPFPPRPLAARVAALRLLALRPLTVAVAVAASASAAPPRRHWLSCIALHPAVDRTTYAAFFVAGEAGQEPRGAARRGTVRWATMIRAGRHELSASRHRTRTCRTYSYSLVVYLCTTTLRRAAGIC